MKNGRIDFPGERLAFIGIGGGSDCIQAAILAIMVGKPCCVISIRANKTTSQSANGAMGEDRTIDNHGGEVARGVFRVLPESTGSGRFLESIPAHLVRMYSVIDYKDERLSQQIQAALDDFGGIETIVAVDTGGDCLYRTSVEDSTKATPDQDLDSLNAINLLDRFNRQSCVIAKGIDSPDYADDILRQAEARAVEFTADERARILSLYKEFQMDGSHPDRYGKTPFAWQAALRGETGQVRLPLPDKVVNDPRNPWNPYVTITAEMAGCHVMDVRKHLAAIARPRPQ